MRYGWTLIPLYGWREDLSSHQSGWYIPPRAPKTLHAPLLPEWPPKHTQSTRTFHTRDQNCESSIDKHYCNCICLWYNHMGRILSPGTRTVLFPLVVSSVPKSSGQVVTDVQQYYGAGLIIYIIT